MNDEARSDASLFSKQTQNKQPRMGLLLEKDGKPILDCLYWVL